MGSVYMLLAGPVVLMLPAVLGARYGSRLNTLFARLLNRFWGIMFPGNGLRLQAPVADWAVVAGS
jgi:hypothetical protein